MTEADFQNRFSKLTELISLLQYGRRISILDTTGNIICLADYLAETSYYIINKHLYNKAKELISYKELFLKVHHYCLSDNAAPEARQMAKECDFINCYDVLDNLEQWLNDNKENSSLNTQNIIKTERAKKYFAKAEEIGYLERTNTGYKSKFKTKVLLAYFLELVFCRDDNNKDNSQNFPETALNELFQEKRLGKYRGQIYNNANGKPKGYEIVDKIFD